MAAPPDQHTRRISENPSRWALISGQGSSISDGESGKGTPFMRAITRFLEQNEDEYSSFVDLAQFVKEATASNYRQIPISGRIREAGDAGGEFFFEKREKTASSQEQDEPQGKSNIEVAEAPVSNIDTVLGASYSSDSDKGEDKLGIMPDVWAFTKLVASKELKPPLSIGLFGDWGSGKSFFMEKLKEEVDTLVGGVNNYLEAEAEKALETFLAQSPAQQADALESLMVSEEVQYDKLRKGVLEGKAKSVYQVQQLVYETVPQADKTDSLSNAEITNATTEVQKKLTPEQRMAKAKNQTEAIIREWVREGGDTASDAFLHLLAEKKLKERDRILEKIRSDKPEKKRHGVHIYKRLVSDKEEEKAGFCRNIAQIEFNAWHYMDSNLWASLITFILSQLSLYVGNKSEEEKEEIKLYEKLATTEAIKAEAKATRRRMASEKAELEKQLGTLTTDKEKIKNSLEGISLTQTIKTLVQEDDTVKKMIKEGSEKLGMTPLSETSKDLIERGMKIDEVIKDYHSTWKQTAMVMKSFSPVKGWKPFLALLLVIVVPLLAMWGLTKVDDLNLTKVGSGIVEFATIVVAAMTGLLGLLGKVIPHAETILDTAKAGLTTLETARKQLEDQASHQINAQIDALQSKYDSLIKQEEDLHTRLSQVDLDSNKAIEELDDIEKGRHLSHFLENRIGSNEYQRYLGLVSIIREDFNRLTDYLHNKDVVQTSRFEQMDESEKIREKESLIRKIALNPKNKIDRIILYIDDLDRCPPDKVVEVLQAIHLILAFPLFVVVVGVDVRWISKSLLKQYGSMLRPSVLAVDDLFPQDDDHPEEGGLIGSGTQYDYLEKIFQIPFRLKPMNQQAKLDYIDDLLKGDIEEAETPKTTDSLSQSEVDALLDNVNLPEQKQTAEDELSPVSNLDQKQESQSIIPQTNETPEGEPLENEDAPVSTTPEPPKKSAKAPRHFAKAKLTPDEKRFIKTLTPILSDSPRAVKRFINTCRLIKSHDRWGKSSTKAGDQEVLSSYESMVFLLSMVTGLPHFSAWFFEKMDQERVTMTPEQIKATTLQELITSTRSTFLEGKFWTQEELWGEWAAFCHLMQIKTGLIEEDDQHPPEPPTPETTARVDQLNQLSMARLIKDAEVASRFSFRFARY